MGQQQQQQQRKKMTVFFRTNNQCVWLPRKEQINAHYRFGKI